MTQSSKTSPADSRKRRKLTKIIPATRYCSGGVPAAEGSLDRGDPSRYRRDAAAALARPTTSTFHRWKNARESSAGTWVR